MLKTNFLSIIFVVLTTSFFQLFSQISSNSPYTYYGIGETERMGFSQSSSMGGMGIGLRTSSEINYLNPASYNAQDSLTFLMDAGVSQSFVNAKNPTTQANFSQFNIDHISFAFPVTKWWGSAIGISPYSNVAYRIVADDFENSTQYSYNGNGGLNQLFVGNSFGLLNNKLNLGCNVSYLFGNINNADSILTNDYYSISQIKYREVAMRGLNLNFGLQYIKHVSDKNFILLGLVYDYSSNIDAQIKDQLLTWSSATSMSSNPDTVFMVENVNSSFKTPAKIGFGVSFNTEKIIFGVDYSTRQWSKAKFWDKSFDVQDSESYNVGCQYTPDRNSFRSYYKRIDYRVGLFYHNTYWNIKNKPINDYGITFGCGLPFSNSKSTFNIGLTVGKRGDSENGFLGEYYTKVSISLKFSELWFYKHRYN